MIDVNPMQAFKSSAGTQYIQINVYEMRWDEMFSDILSSFSSDVVAPTATAEATVGPQEKTFVEKVVLGVGKFSSALEKYLKDGDNISAHPEGFVKSLYLPMPNVMREVHHQIYEDSSYNMEDRFLRNGVTAVREMLKMGGTSIGSGLSEGIGSVVDLFDHTMKRANISADTDNVMTYAGSAPRSHTFSFNLVPQNELEAEYYKMAISQLKLFSLSKRQKLADPFNSTVGLNTIRQAHIFTMEFVISQKNKDILELTPNIHLNTLFASDNTITAGFSLTDVTSTLGNDGIILYDDGTPKHITLSLSFTERKPLWYDDLTKFYNPRFKK